VTSSSECLFNVIGCGLPGYSKAPTLSNSLQEMTLAESVGLDRENGPDAAGSSGHQGSNTGNLLMSGGGSGTDGQGLRRTRRASMQDALDFTKFNASLYERPVS